MVLKIDYDIVKFQKNHIWRHN